jgi:hypothetical protein
MKGDFGVEKRSRRSALVRIYRVSIGFFVCCIIRFLSLIDTCCTIGISLDSARLVAILPFWWASSHASLRT